MTTRFHSAVFFLIALFFSVTAMAQEKLVPLSGNMHLMSIPPAATPAKKTQSLPSIHLPFFENFNYAYKMPFPASSLWLDSNVYINTGFPIAPRDLGVATFDGLDKRGYPYNFSATGGSSSSADTLTSVTINLKHSATNASYNIPGDSLVFSFYYQAEGNGDSPEPPDSLCLEFLNRNSVDTVWKHIWGIKGYNPSAPDTGFHYVSILITDPTYADSLFQFRFRNKATTSGSLDHWHIDDIFLNSVRSVIQDTNSNLLTRGFFAYPSKGLLKNYFTMPYEQFNAGEMGDSLRYLVRNNADMASANVSIRYQIYNQNSILEKDTAQSGNAFPFKTSGYAGLDVNHTKGVSLHGYVFGSGDVTPVPIPFTSPTYYPYKTILTNGGLVDSIVQQQHFDNYYAYDDGAAEVAYYLNTTGGKIAQRFTLHAPDTLWGANIFFDPISYNATQLHEFRIAIWDGSSGQPSTRLYQDSTMNPVYLKWGYNAIPEYLLTTRLVLQPGTYYIGIKQTDVTPLNIGFDKNNHHMDALYYDIGFGWTQSTIPGSLMINPLFGKKSMLATGIEEKTIARKEFQVYPNPAQDQVYIHVKNDNTRYTDLEIMSVMGQTALQTRYDGANSAIDISGLQSGIYFIYLSGQDSRSVPEKLIISR